MRILLIEDCDNEAMLIQHMLKEAFGAIHITRASTLDEGVHLHSSGLAFDVLLLDIILPDSRGYQTFVRAKNSAPGVPIVILTGHSNNELALQTLREGAQDYIPKDRLTPVLLERAIRYALERRRAAEALSNSEHFVRATLNALSAHIAILDGNGNILEVNESWRRFALANGSPSAGQAGHNYLDICDRAIGDSSEGAVEVANRIRQVISGVRTDFYCEYPCHSASEQRWFSMRVTRFRGEGLIRVVVSHENITQRKRAEGLESERLALQDAVKAMDQVLGVVGHELRSPLAGLRAMSELLSDPLAGAQAQFQSFMQSIHSEVIRMSDIVDNLLEAARLNSGRARWNWETFPLEPVCREALESARPLIDASRITLACRIRPLEMQMLGDAGGLRRLIVNLVSNARKHTTSGRIDVELLALRIKNQNWIELKVSDTGSGIEPAIAARLGEAFALNSGVVGVNYVSGTGLGLAICKGIAAAHGGVVKIASSPQTGTTVTVTMRADLIQPVAFCHHHHAAHILKTELLIGAGK